MTIQEIIKYLNDTPNNTNPNVVASMIQELGAGGSVPSILLSVEIANGLEDIQLISLTETGEFEAVEYKGPQSLEFTVAANAIFAVIAPDTTKVVNSEGDEMGITLTSESVNYTIMVPTLDGTAVYVESNT